MSASLTPSPKMQFFDANGDPLVGGKLYTYAAGTTTPLATYTDSTGGTPNENPVVMNARGEASVWLGTSPYYFELKDSAGSLIWTADNITGQITASQVQSGAYQWLTSVSGADTITATASPVPSAYAAGQTFRFVSAGANTGAATLNVASLGAKSITKNGTNALAAGDIPSGAVVEVTYDGTQFQLISAGARAGANSDITSLSAVTRSSTDEKVQEFRLTLTSGTPVTTANVTGATTIYCTPYKGNRIALYDGTNWNIRTSAEFSLALGTLTSGKPYDIFCYDNSGVPTLEFLVWTNDTTRATALAYQDGVLVKSGAATRRYLGTFYTTSTTQTEDSVANRYLWNYYHRVPRSVRAADATDSWTYTTAAWRQANGSTANQINVVVGVSEDSVSLLVLGGVRNTNIGVAVSIGIGYDSTTAISAGCITTAQSTLVANQAQPISAYTTGVVEAGRHYLAWLEYSAATGTSTWFGDGASPGVVASGISGEVMA